MSSSICQNRLDHIHIVQLPTARIHGLQQLIHLLVTHLFAQVGEDIAKLAHADEARELFVEDLEAAAVFFRLAGVAEAVGAVEEFGEGFEVDCFTFIISILSARYAASPHTRGWETSGRMLLLLPLLPPLSITHNPLIRGTSEGFFWEDI